MGMADDKLTEFTRLAIGLAQRFEMYFGPDGALARRKELPVGFRFELTAPDGPSTGGGKRAVQHIKIVPAAGATVVLGSTNAAEGTAEVRSYEYLAWVHEQRFKGKPLPLAQSDYQLLHGKVVRFLALEKLKVSQVEPPVEAAPAAAVPAAAENPPPAPIKEPAAASESGPASTVGTGVVIALLIAVFVLLMLSLRH
jgi:hypothetical protein